MDVGCPQCQTEYELDDDRVGEDGVTVKCTTCGHVFRVKKKQLVVTLPARSEAGATPLEAIPATDLPPPPPSREWRLRQASGNVFACRDLTMLQKWIIEGKVVRDDEISLTGETWKRLGNIPELASFFQIVDDAAKARALEAIHRSAPPSAPVPAPKITDTWRGGQFSSPPAKASPAAGDETIPFHGDPSRRETPREFPAPEVKPQPETLQGGRFSTPAADPETLPPEPPPKRRQTPQGPQFAKAPEPAVPPLTETLKGGSFAAQPSGVRSAAREPSDEELSRAVKGSGGGKWAALILLGLGVGGGVGYYFGVYEPEQRAAELKRQEDAARVEAERLAALQPPDVVTPVVVDASVEEEPSDAGAEVPDAGAPLPDAGVADAGAVVALVDAGAVALAPVDGDAGVGAPVVVEQKRTFDWYVAQGERLRDREKPEQSLDMYAKASELKPERVEPIAGRGLALLDMANYAGAAAAFEQALKFSPRYGPAIMGLAEAYRLQGKNEKAVQYYERYLEVLPNGSEAAVARNSIERLKPQ